MHVYVLIHLAFWWAAKIVAGKLVWLVLKATWEAITAWFSSPVWVPSFSLAYAESHILRDVGVILLVVGVVAASILVCRRMTRIPLPTAC
jgi:hypothetical protein